MVLSKEQELYPRDVVDFAVLDVVRYLVGKTYGLNTSRQLWLRAHLRTKTLCVQFEMSRGTKMEMC